MLCHGVMLNLWHNNIKHVFFMLRAEVLATVELPSAMVKYTLILQIVIT